MTRSRVLQAAFVTSAALACLSSARASGNEVQLIDVHPRPADIGERTYFIANGAGEDDAVALRDQLIAAGAWNVNLFVQDRVVVCNLPPAVAATLSVPAVFSRQSTVLAQSHARTTHATWSWITDAYDRVDNPPAHAVRAGAWSDDTPFDDVVLTQTPEEVRAIQRELEASGSRRADAPKPQPARNMKQNSEILTGSILVNFIYPESDGGLEASTQDWSEDDQREAIVGATMAYLAWQAWTQMDINTTFNHIEGVATRYEPIMHDMSSDELWINDTMQTLGWGQHSTNSLGVVHEFNDAMRATYHTQWVVTCFIANARGIYNHRFGGGNANYTAYANLGGPFMVEPFPAGTDPNAIGETLVFSKIVQHECGHCFWTLDEYPGSPGGCGDTSGYLDYANGNISMTGPGGEELRCEALQPCIMHNAPRIGQDRPWCRYSLGHLGVIDNNNNGYADIFEAAPEIVFEPAGAETLLTNQYTLRFRAVARAVPNRNRGQDPNERVDYAAPVGQVRLAQGASGINLAPVDGHLDEREEEFELRMSLTAAGPSVFVIRARNSVGFQSPPYTKTVYFLGVNYTYVGASVQENRIEVAWETAGDSFNSQFDVYRLDGGEPMPGTRIAQQVPPESNGTSGFVPYRYHDWNIQPGHTYQYYVVGSFTLPYEDSTRTYNAPSKVVGQTAAIPSADGDFVSGIAPNPSNGNVTFSVNVPRSYDLSPRIPQRVATPVNVEVYDVLGRRVRVLADEPQFQDYITLRWDGRNQKNTPLPAGVYFVRVRAGEAEAVRKLVLMR